MTPELATAHFVLLAGGIGIVIVCAVLTIAALWQLFNEWRNRP